MFSYGTKPMPVVLFVGLAQSQICLLMNNVFVTFAIRW